MPAKTQRRPNQSPALNTRQRVQYNTHSDFDSDAQTPIPAMPSLSQIPQALQHPHLPRTNEVLNLSVLQRHNPSIALVLSISPYAVIYTFSPSAQTWEKSGIEGTLFICQLFPPVNSAQTGLERYSVVVLNRRGLDNFEVELTREEDVEITEEYVILQGKSGDSRLVGDSEDVDVQDDDASRVVYGVWIFAEAAPSATAHMRELNARLIQDCAVQAEASRKALDMRRTTDEAHMLVGGGHAPQDSHQFGNDRVKYDDHMELHNQGHDLRYAIPPDISYAHQQRPGALGKHETGYDGLQDTNYHGIIYNEAQQEMNYDGQRQTNYDTQHGLERRHRMAFEDSGGTGYGDQAGMQGEYRGPTGHNGQGSQVWESQVPPSFSRPVDNGYATQASLGMDSRAPDVLGDLFRKARQGYSSTA